MSTFMWLDYSEREQRNMLDIVDQFREHDTRDELGLGSVRDAFSDTLFPGTSTIMTRARYFLLVPWTYRRLEGLRVNSTEIAARARKAELGLIQPIKDSDDNDGNIGAIAKSSLKRLPSSVYWQGLAVWGIRTFSGSQAHYHRSLDNFYMRLSKNRSRATEHDVENDDLVSLNWHAGLIEAPTDYPVNCSLAMTTREAEYLAERIRLSPGCSESLLAQLVVQPQRDVMVDFAWEHPYCAKVSPQLREILHHAQNFSEVMHGAQLLYNLILAEQACRQDLIDKYLDSLVKWSQTITTRADDLKRWEPKRFWEIVFAGNDRITKPTRDFIDSWCHLAIFVNAPDISIAKNARLLIRERERQLKKHLARIDNPRAQELWNEDSGSAQLDFRWSISRRLLGDIFDGLEASHA